MLSGSSSPTSADNFWLYKSVVYIFPEVFTEKSRSILLYAEQQFLAVFQNEFKFRTEDSHM